MLDRERYADRHTGLRESQSPTGNSSFSVRKKFDDVMLHQCLIPILPYRYQEWTMFVVVYSWSDRLAHLPGDSHHSVSDENASTDDHLSVTTIIYYFVNIPSTLFEMLLLQVYLQKYEVWDANCSCYIRDSMSKYSLPSLPYHRLTQSQHSDGCDTSQPCNLLAGVSLGIVKDKL